MNIYHYFERLLANEGYVQASDAELHEAVRQTFLQDEELRAVAMLACGQPDASQLDASPLENPPDADSTSSQPLDVLPFPAARSSHRQQLPRVFPSAAATALQPIAPGSQRIAAAGYTVSENGHIEICLPAEVAELAEFGFIQLCVELDGELVESKFMPLRIAGATSQARVDLHRTDFSRLQEKDAVLSFVCDSESLLAAMTLTCLRELKDSRLYANDRECKEKMDLFEQRLREHLT